MKLHVRHRTLYDYAQPASLSHNHVCLQPRNTATQQCLHSWIDVNPAPDSIRRGKDIFGNTTARFSLSKRHGSCDIVISSLIETSDELSALPSSLPAADNLRHLNQLTTDDALLAQDCLLSSPYIRLPEVRDTLDQLLAEIPMGSYTVLEYAQKMMQHIFSTFSYTSGFSNLVTPLSKIYTARKGVCQDFAHLAIAALRRQGIPTRYVSGYLETLPPPGQKKLQGADASHAWYAVFDAQQGWFDFDPTNNKRPDLQYITTAWGRDYADVTPIKGMVYGGGQHALTVEVDVTRADATKPVLMEV